MNRRRPHRDKDRCEEQTKQAEALLAQFPPEARNFLNPENPIFDTARQPQGQKSPSSETDRPADGRDLKRMGARTRARGSLIIAALLSLKTQKDIEAMGIPWAEVNAYKRNYPSFRLLYEQARRIGNEGRTTIRLEEAHERAVEGWDEPVYHKGVQCGTVRCHSDKLLALLLAGDDPARFSPHKQLTASHAAEREDQLTAILAKIAERGRFDPLRDLPGNARHRHETVDSEAGSATKLQPDQTEGPIPN